MAKQRKKTRRDTAEIARENLEQIIGEKLNGEPLEKSEPEAPTESGASAGGKARAKNMTPRQRQESARKAARARWDHCP